MAAVSIVGALLAVVLTTRAVDQPPGQAMAIHGQPSAAASSTAPVGEAATSSATPPATTPPAATVSPEDAALARLADLRTESLASVSLDSRWVAQVASKNVGIFDPLQHTRSDSSTFYAVDILQEVQDLQNLFGGYPVYVLASSDFGRSTRAPDGAPYWTTLVDGGFSSAEDVRAWCARAYVGLPAEQVVNACAPRRLSPPT